MLIGIVGASGSGKSTSMRNLNPEETVIIATSNKPLPFRNGGKFKEGLLSQGGNFLISSNAADIIEALRYIDDNMPHIKSIILDDTQFIQGFMFMEKAKDKGFEKFNDIGLAGFSPIKAAMQLKRVNKDLDVFVTYHYELDDDGNTKIKTAGKLVDRQITLEGLFTAILFADNEIDPIKKTSNYYFLTNTQGFKKAKSPMDMFQEIKIPNDLALVKEAIRNYYSEEQNTQQQTTEQQTTENS
jgi:hypothetical protein